MCSLAFSFSVGGGLRPASATANASANTNASGLYDSEQYDEHSADALLQDLEATRIRVAHWDVVKHMQLIAAR